MLCKLPNHTRVDTRHDCTLGSCGRRQLIRLMTESSIEQLLRYRHLTMPRGSVSIAVSDITDFMALYLYRCQLYQRCELLCQQTIRRDLIDVDINRIPLVSATYHEFVQLVDDDVASLVGLIVLLNHGRLQSWSEEPITVTHLTLSLYLLTKCQIRVMATDCVITSIDPGTLSTLAVILDWVAVAQKTIPVDSFVDHLLLKLVERKAVIYLTKQLNDPNSHSTNFVHNIHGLESGKESLNVPDALKILFEILNARITGQESLNVSDIFKIAIKILNATITGQNNFMSVSLLLKYMHNLHFLSGMLESVLL